MWTCKIGTQLQFHSITYIFVLCFSFYRFSQINLRSIFAGLFLKRFAGAGVSVYLNLEQTNDPQPSHIVIPAFDVITGFGMKNLLSSVCRLWLSFIH